MTDESSPPACLHANLTLEVTAEGYFSGGYVCIGCGQALSVEDLKKNSSRQNSPAKTDDD